MILANKEAVFKHEDYIVEHYFLEKQGEAKVSPISQSTFEKPNKLKRGNTSNTNSTVTKDVSKKFFTVSISPINWKDNQCLLLTLKDTTTDKIVDQKKLLEELKNKIFKSYTHELQTPLNGISMSLETA